MYKEVIEVESQLSPLQKLQFCWEKDSKGEKRPGGGGVECTLQLEIIFKLIEQREFRILLLSCCDVLFIFGIIFHYASN